MSVRNGVLAFVHEDRRYLPCRLSSARHGVGAADHCLSLCIAGQQQAPAARLVMRRRAAFVETIIAEVVNIGLLESLNRHLRLD